VTYHVTAKLDPGYHIYKYSKTRDDSGPFYTNFDIFDTAGLEVAGDWSASTPPERHKDPNVPGVEFVEYHENGVTWSIKLRVPEGAESGPKVLRCQAGYMVCDAHQCSFPGQWTLPDAVLTIASADGNSPERPSESQAKAGQPAADKVAPPSVAAASPVLALSQSRSVGSQSLAPARSGAIATADKSDTAPGASSKSAAPSGLEPGLGSKSTGPSQKGASSAIPGAGGPKIQSEIAEEAERGLIPFLIASALGGLFALVMPCVWPMIPITVNFFVKQGQGPGGRSKSTGLAITYCLSIIAVFTAVGVLFAFFFSAASLQNLANNPWLNLFVAALFVIFGISLLGLFELRLPSFLLNASAQGESRGGLIGVVFMALTLTITSFTCTFPVVGGLLVMAAGGSFLYPILGLATFAAVVALPFFLLALSPGLIARVPRSGDWMNAVKVVGGLVEIGAALKFINTAELAFVTPENAWFDAHVVLTSWIALSVVCGLYLLGLFRTNHDHDEVKVGPGRLVFGTLFLGLALYMSPALFGRPPRSLVWDRLIVGILPPDSNELAADVAPVAGGDVAAGAPLEEIKATSNEPSQAEREEKKAHGVLWGMSYDQARERAADEHKPILIDFTGVNCPNCRLMERTVLRRPEVVALLKKFVTVQLYTDFVPIGSITRQQRAELAEINQDRLLNLAQEQTNPIYVALSPGGELLSRIGGYREPGVFVDFLSKALSKHSNSGKSASASSMMGSGSREPSLATAENAVGH
jgi:thiol:disulfide interchange protein DsbD